MVTNCTVEQLHMTAFLHGKIGSKSVYKWCYFHMEKISCVAAARMHNSVSSLTCQILHNRFKYLQTRYQLMHCNTTFLAMWKVCIVTSMQPLSLSPFLPLPSPTTKLSPCTYNRKQWHTCTTNKQELWSKCYLTRFKPYPLHPSNKWGNVLATCHYTVPDNIPTYFGSRERVSRNWPVN